MRLIAYAITLGGMLVEPSTTGQLTEVKTIKHQVAKL